MAAKGGLAPLKEDESFEDERIPAGMKRADPDTLLNLSEISLGPEIGHGAFSHVYKGSFQGHEVAVKKMKLVDRDGMKYLESELAMLKNFKHDHLIKYYGAAIAGKDVYIVTEFMAGGDLSSLICKSGLPLPWKLRARLARDALSGIVELHNDEIVHRDIKTENILVDDKWRCVVADYGFARKARKGAAMTICGSDNFMAPEVIWGEVYDERADVFSFGVVLWEIIYRKVPGQDGFAERGPRTKFKLDIDALKDGAPADAPASLVNLAASCCAYEPDDRITSDEALEWLDDLTKELEAAEAAVPIPPVPVAGAAAAAGGASAAAASPTGSASGDPASPAAGGAAAIAHSVGGAGTGDPGAVVLTPSSAASDPTRVVSTPAAGSKA